MLRRWRSLKKIVYAASILFVTIILYAGTSSNDYGQDKNTEWILPIAARDTLRVDAALQEPLHRLPLGPFEDHAVPVVVETFNMQIPSFEDKSNDDLSPSNSAIKSPVNGPPPALPANAAPKPAAPAPAAVAAAPPQPAPAAPPAVAAVPAPAPAPAANAAPPHPPAPAPPPAAGGAAPHPPPAVAPPPPAAAPPPPAAALPPPAAAPAPVAPLAPQQPPPPPPSPLKPLPDLTKTTAEMASRLNHTKTQCEKFQVPNQVDTEVYLLPNQNLSYCKVPKAGCTYWEQVISYLNKPVHELSYLGIRSPFQISKFDIRFTSHLNLPRRDFKLLEDHTAIMKTNKVLFVRHPLERLWSCYLEKFYLIDYWTTAGLQMKTAGADNKCPKSITFREFIDFTLPLFNENWAPITELCNPCTFQPNIIGHVETFREDSFYVLKQAKLDWIFAEQEKMSREENQMLDTVIYNYQIHSIHWYSFYHRCLSQKELAAKLWDVFKKVGYLSSHAVLPDNLPDFNQTTIIKEIKSQFRKYPLGPVNGRAQQLKMMRRDFESLPKPVMAKVLERYAMDFQLFGYSTQLPTA